MKNNKGFTLMEVLVVFMIIAVLVAIIIPNLSSIVHYAKEKLDYAKLRNLNFATSIYRTEQGTEGEDIYATLMAAEGDRTRRRHAKIPEQQCAALVTRG